MKPSSDLQEAWVIIEKAIRKAIDNGYEHDGWRTVLGLDDTEALKWDPEDWQDYLLSGLHRILLFDHGFTKSLWPEDHCSKQNELNYDDHSRHLPHHSFHEEQMAIVDDPIKYLGENI